jgi:hypothetical protein
LASRIALYSAVRSLLLGGPARSQRFGVLALVVDERHAGGRLGLDGFVVGVNAVLGAAEAEHDPRVVNQGLKELVRCRRLGGAAVALVQRAQHGERQLVTRLRGTPNRPLRLGDQQHGEQRHADRQGELAEGAGVFPLHERPPRRPAAD